MASFGADRFEPHPASFGPELESGGLDKEWAGIECIDPSEQTDIGITRWIWFTDQGRYFHLLVVIGDEASEETIQDTATVLDNLIIEPREGT